MPINAGDTLAKAAKPKATRKGKPSPVAEPKPVEKAAKAPKEPKEKGIKVKTRGPVVVNNRDEEYDSIARETCSCGGGFEIEMEEVRPASETQGPLDVLKTLCNECGSHVDFLFDISSFYDGGVEGFEAETDGGSENENEDEDGGWL